MYGCILIEMHLKRKREKFGQDSSFEIISLEYIIDSLLCDYQTGVPSILKRILIYYNGLVSRS